MSVSIPDSVTSIGDYAFSSCSSLISLRLGSNVALFNDTLVSYCTNLEEVFIDSPRMKFSPAALDYAKAVIVYISVDSVAITGIPNFVCAEDSCQCGPGYGVTPRVESKRGYFACPKCISGYWAKGGSRNCTGCVSRQVHAQYCDWSNQFEQMQ